MIARLLFAGSGGQGVLTIGNILGNAAMLEDFHVTFLPEYGAAMRGGTANCTLCISDQEIASPVVSSPDFLLSMNQPSVLTFINRLQSGGRLLYNSSIVDEIPVRGDISSFPVPASELAQEMGNIRSTNMIILGSFVKLAKVVKIESLQKSVEMLMGRKKKVAESVIKAMMTGYDKFPFE
ncbi:MAG: 2-oxoacid:acceptor oxidoreductase family protein [bacterium]